MTSKNLTFVCLVLAMLSGWALFDELYGAELTKPITLAWDQRASDFVVAQGQTKPPLANWKLYQRDTPGGPTTAVVAVPVVPAQLGAAVSGNRTYTYGPFNVTATGLGGRTVQRCWVVSAVGNDTPPTESAMSNEACDDFVLPADPLPPPGTPKSLKVNR
jgi:hypothetical protein